MTVGTAAGSAESVVKERGEDSSDPTDTVYTYVVAGTRPVSAAR